MDSFKKMSEMPLRDEAIERVIRKIFAVEPTAVVTDISTRKKNSIDKFADSLNTSIQEQGTTIWALFNGVTRYTNHVLSNKDDMNYLMVGNGNRMSNITFDELMKFVEENTKKEFA